MAAWSARGGARHLEIVVGRRDGHRGHGILAKQRRVRGPISLMFLSVCLICDKVCHI